MKKISVIARLMRFAGKGGAPLLLLSALLAALTVSVSLYVPILTGRAVDLIVSPQNVAFAGILKILMTMLVLVLFCAGIQWLLGAVNNRLAYTCARGLRDQAFDKLTRLPLSYLDARGAGDTLSRVVADVDTVTDGLLMGFTQLFTGLITIAGTLAVMLTISPAIALIVILVTPISLFVAAFIAKRTYDLFAKQAGQRAEQTQFVDEMIGGMKTVQAFGREASAKERFDEIDERLKNTSLRAVFYSSITNPSTRFVNALVYALVAVFGAIACARDALTVGSLIAFLSYASQYTKPFNEISGVLAEMQNTIACALRVFELIDETPEPADSANPESFQSEAGEVALSRVYFSYDPRKPLIRDFSLAVRPGSRIAIVGPTGCGKTTLINLLMRFYDVNGGTITVDGADIARVPRKTLRARYGMVLQDTWIKSGTVKDNIRVGDPEATEERIIAAAKAAHAHSFITRLPDGYDTVIGEGGALSQGQRQLLCIARVMLRTPSILILDEATSSIDTRTELKIQSAFQTLMKGRTSFIVAHRLSTIRSADTILVMRDGQVIETGNHEQLIKKGGFYCELYKSQYQK